MHAENAFAIEILSLIVMLLALPDNYTIHSDCMSAMASAIEEPWPEQKIVSPRTATRWTPPLFCHRPAAIAWVKAHQDDDFPFDSLDRHAQGNIFADWDAAGDFEATDRTPL
jgi:hypothetical protein